VLPHLAVSTIIIVFILKYINNDFFNAQSIRTGPVMLRFKLSAQLKRH